MTRATFVRCAAAWLLVTSGCYDSHLRQERLAVSPCEIPDFDGRVLDELVLDGRGFVTGEPFPTGSVVELPGALVSLSDDGRWVAGGGWNPTGTVELVDVTDVSSGEVVLSVPVTLGSEWPVLSGDGSTLAYVELDEATGERTLWLIDRASATRRFVARGALSSPALSDDGTIVLVARDDDPEAPGGAIVRYDVTHGTEEVVARDDGEGRGGPVISGDGRWVAHVSQHASAMFRTIVRGPAFEWSRDRMAGGRLSFSDDGCQFLSSTGDHLGPVAADSRPALDLVWVVRDRTQSSADPGTRRAIVRGVALSGDGSTAVFLQSVDLGGVASLTRVRLADGRAQTMSLGCGSDVVRVSADAAVVAVDVFACDGEPVDRQRRTRVLRPGAW